MTPKHSASPRIGNPAPITGIACAIRRRAQATASSIGSSRTNVDNRKTLTL